MSEPASPSLSNSGSEPDEVRRAKELRRVEEQMVALYADEAAGRLAIDSDSSGALRLLKVDATKSARKARDRARERERREQKQEELDDRNAVLDHWAPVKSARSGAITFTVVRAENVGGFFSAALLHTNPYVVVSYGKNVTVESEVVRHDECPEFDFTTYFVVEDDTQPVIVQVMERAVSSRIGVGMSIGGCAINLRKPYKNLTKSAPDGVYTEKCRLILPVYDATGKKLNGMTVTVEWSLELRDTNKVVFCDDCGRLDVRCTCTEEERAARHEAAAQEGRLRLMQETLAQNVRVQQENEVIARDAILEEERHARALLERERDVSAAKVNAVRRHQKLEGRKQGAGANVAAAGAAGGSAGAASASQGADADADRDSHAHEPVDLLARDDLNKRGAADAEYDEGAAVHKSTKADSGGCCVIA